MGRKVDVDDLIDTHTVADLIGLALSEYQSRYGDMPRPVIDLGGGRSKLWLRSEVERWVARHRQRAAGRGRPRLSAQRS